MAVLALLKDLAEGKTCVLNLEQCHEKDAKCYHFDGIGLPTPPSWA